MLNKRKERERVKLVHGEIPNEGRELILSMV